MFFGFVASGKANLLQLLGDFVEYSKETFEEENVLAILKLCLDTLDEQLHGKKPVMVLMAGAVKCLDSLLTWFDDSLPAGGTALIDTVFLDVLHPARFLNL